MKKFALFFLLIGYVQIGISQAQTKPFNRNSFHKIELTKEFASSNFSHLWTKTKNEAVYGFIGDKYQRIRIKFISVKKIPTTNNYAVSGKSMVKTNICDFYGTIVINSITKLKTTSFGVDDNYKNKSIIGQFEIIGNYTFSETKKQPHSGTFKGSFKTCFYMDKSNNIIYDDIDLNADGYSNNEFAGTWKMYDSNFSQSCNWGDFRAPDSGDLDIGAGEFSPNDKYLKNGWQNFRDAYTSNNPNLKAALKIEQAKWWK